jgi:hypothetical protein
MNGQSFLRSPGPTKGGRANDDDDGDDNDHAYENIYKETEST